MTYAEVLESIGRAMGRAPRKLGLFQRRWRMQPPPWIGQDPYTQEVFSAQDQLLSRGRLAWGAVVQANTILFTNTGPDSRTNSGADIIWSDAQRSLDDPEAMLPVARELFAFKAGAGMDAETDHMGALLADEFLRKRRIPVPTAWSPAYPTVMSSIFVDRAHLPAGYLGGSLLPLLVLPEATDAVMIAPGFFWPKRFVETAWG